MDEGKQTLIDMIIGIILCDILFMIPGAFWNGRRVVFILGLIFGAVMAIFMAIHMYHAVLRSLDMDEKSAVSYSRKMSGMRMVCVTVILALTINFANEFTTLGMLLGILCLKFSAYIQPLTHKYISSKFINKGR